MERLPFGLDAGPHRFHPLGHRPPAPNRRGGGVRQAKGWHCSKSEIRDKSSFCVTCIFFLQKKHKIEDSGQQPLPSLQPTI